MEEREAEADSSSSENLSEDGEGEEPINDVSDYEQQRLARIRENRARLEALGLPTLSSSLLASSSKKELGLAKKAKKKKGDEEDEDYQPSDEDDGQREKRDGESCSDTDEEEEEAEEKENVGLSPSSQRKRKKKCHSNAAGVKERLLTNKNQEDLDLLDEDAALQHAIALSLGKAAENATEASDVISLSSDRMEDGARACVKRDKTNMQEPAGRRKSRKMGNSRVQLTEDEVVAYFFTFDEAGKGYICLRDLQRMVLAHDFNWTELEVAQMIHSFDTDGDGKLSLEDFRAIVSRCKMMQAAG